MNTQNSYNQRFQIIMFSLLVFVGIDQVTKAFARNLLVDRSIAVCDFLYFELHYNTGLTLGLGSELSALLRFSLYAIVPVAAIVVALFCLCRLKLPKTFVLAVSICCACLFSNTLDRLMFGAVTDFIFIRLGTSRSVAFNLADFMDWPALAYVVYWILKWAIEKDREKKLALSARRDVDVNETTNKPLQ